MYIKSAFSFSNFRVKNAVCKIINNPQFHTSLKVAGRVMMAKDCYDVAMEWKKNGPEKAAEKAVKILASWYSSYDSYKCFIYQKIIGIMNYNYFCVFSATFSIVL